MDNETKIRSRAIAGSLHSGTSDLLAENMKAGNGVFESALSNRSAASDVSYAPSILYWGSVSLAVGTVSLLGVQGTLLTYDSLGPWSAGIALGSLSLGLIGIPKMAAKIFESYDAKRLNACMVSDKPRERIYYTNRILTYLLRHSPEKTTLFDNPYILGYALWLDENYVQRPLWKFSNILRRIFLAECTTGWFEVDLSYPVYIEVAKDMVNGVFAKGAFPVEAKTEEQRELFKKAKEIIKRRHVNKSKVLDEMEVEEAKQVSAN